MIAAEDVRTLPKHGVARTAVRAQNRIQASAHEEVSAMDASIGHEFDDGDALAINDISDTESSDEEMRAKSVRFKEQTVVEPPHSVSELQHDSDGYGHMDSMVAADNTSSVVRAPPKESGADPHSWKPPDANDGDSKDTVGGANDTSAQKESKQESVDDGMPVRRSGRIRRPTWKLTGATVIKKQQMWSNKRCGMLCVNLTPVSS